jgi:ADP-heptose:LPS heptosyltransferase
VTAPSPQKTGPGTLLSPVRDALRTARETSRRRAHQKAKAAQLGGGTGRGVAGDVLRAIGRALVLGLANLLWPRPRAELPRLVDVRKLLVIRVDERVGNQLLTTPLLRALKLGVPHAELHLLAPRQGHVVDSPHVDRRFLWQKRDVFKAPLRFLRLLRDLRRERYDIVVEAGHWSAFSLTASLLARLVGSRAIVGHDRGDAARFLSHPVRHDPVRGSEVPAKLELLRPLGLTPRGLELDTSLGADASAAAAAEALLGAAGLGDRALAVLNPGARLADRRWPPDAYAQVARGLSERGLAVLVVWGPGEEPLARAIADGSGACARLAPSTDLALLAALMRRARLVVSNNSGPMHLAVAVRTPTVGVFFSGDSARWGHLVPEFAAAEVRGEDAAAVLSACDRLLARAARS